MEDKNTRSHDNNGTGLRERKNFFPKTSLRDRDSSEPISQTPDTVTDAPAQAVPDLGERDRTSEPLYSIRLGKCAELEATNRCCWMILRQCGRLSLAL